ncbi:MAG TPA: TIGR00730 family Rossman fold protein [Terriglobales bacterium]
MRRVCVFCASSPGARPEYRAAAEEIGTELARRHIGLVYGGGNVGLMGVVADAALAAGCEVIGVIPKKLMARELGHNGLTQLHVVGSMHERKALMADLSDAFIALPGGYGTLDEFCEVLTWSQLGLHSKPCGILNVRGYYSPLLTMFDHAVDERFLKPENRELVLAQDTAPALLDAIERWRAVPVEKWLDRDTR